MYTAHRRFFSTPKVKLAENLTVVTARILGTTHARFRSVDVFFNYFGFKGTVRVNEAGWLVAQIEKIKQ